jgi:hypothetical protein
MVLWHPSDGMGVSPNLNPRPLQEEESLTAENAATLKNREMEGIKVR